MLEIRFVKCPYLQMVSINNPAIRVGFIPNTMEYRAGISFWKNAILTQKWVCKLNPR